jgi:hypothetical protein
MGVYIYEDREYFHTANVRRASCSQCSFTDLPQPAGTGEPPIGGWSGPYADRDEAARAAVQNGAAAINFCQVCCP